MDKKLIYQRDQTLWYNKLFADTIDDTKYERERALLNPFPSDDTLFHFASLVYTDSEKYNTNEDCKIPEGWQFLTEGKSATGYYAGVFWNPQLCQVVIASRGTNPTKWKSLLADAQIVVSNQPDQARSASTFAYIVRRKLKKIFQNKYFQVSITGHSLGGWLAQIQTFTIKYLTVEGEYFVRDDKYWNNIHAHTVVFESPGCREGLRGLTEFYQQGSYGNYRTLDITTYLSNMNPVNRIREHVGVIYRIPVNGHCRDDISKWFKDGKKHKDVLIDFCTGKWEVLFGNDTKAIVKKYDGSKCSLNVFNDNELKFLIRWYELNNTEKIPELKEFEEKYQIPKFEIDEINHAIKVDYVEELSKTIGHIKHMPQDYNNIIETVFTKIIDNQSTNIKDLFSTVGKLFRGNITEFKCIYFKDVYNLKSLLNDNQMVFINMEPNLNSEIEFLETSIVNNILSYYKNSAGYFEDYEILSLKYLPNALNFITRIKNLKLLIIEAYHANFDDVEAIKNYLSTQSLKVIFIVSVDFPNCTPVNVQGVAQKIKLEFLSEESRSELFQRTLELCRKKIALEDVVKIPVTDEDYKHTNEFLTSKVLLELILNQEGTKLFENQLSGTYDTGMHHETSKEIDDVEKLKKFIRENSHKYLFVINDTDDSVALDLPGVFQSKEEVSNDDNKNIYWFSIRNESIFVDKIYDKDFYLPRYILYNKVMSKKFLWDGNLTSHKFIFVSVDDSQLEDDFFGGSDVHIENSLDEAMLQFTNSKTNNIHIFKIEGGNIVWWKSKGEIRNLRRHFDVPKQITEEEFVAKIHEDKTVIVSDEPGMGKSTTTTNLYLQLQKKSPLTFFISLSTCSSHLNKIGTSGVNADSVTTFIFEAGNISSSNLNKALCIYSLLHEKLPVYILFDGYNEIYNDKHANIFINLVKYLIDETTAKVLITTRKHAREAIESALSVFGSTLKKLDSEELEKFCSKFWYDQLILTEDVKMENIKLFSNQLLEYVTFKLGNEISEFIGIPLQMKIAADIMTPNLTKDFSKQLNFTNALELYQKYVETCYQKYFKQHFKPGQESGIAKKWLANAITSKCGKLAIKNHIDYVMEGIIDEDVQELNTVGIVQCDYDNPTFVHPTVTDFYAAQWMVKWLETSFKQESRCFELEKDLLTSFFFTGEFNMLRYFFNGLLKDAEISGLNFQFKKIVELWDSDPNLFFENEESSLHIAIRDGLNFVVEKLLLPIFNNFNNKIRFFAKHNSAEETVLNVATRDKTKKILNTLLELINKWPEEDIKEMLLATLFHTFEEKDDHKRIKELMDHIQSFQKKLPKLAQVLKTVEIDVKNKIRFYGFITSGKVEQFKSMIKNSRSSKLYLQLITKVEKQTLAHLAAIHGQPLIINELNELNCDLNVEDYHGMTPVARAAQKGFLHLVSALIDKGAKDDIYDHSQVSPFMHASKHGYLDILKVMIDKKNNRSDKENLLLHKDKYGMTAFTYATMNGHLKIVEYLAETAFKYFDNEALERIIDLKDANDMTPLLYAVKKKTNLTLDEKLKLVKFLVDKGADVNACTEWIKMTPLLRSIQCRSWNIADYLIKKGANVNIKSRDDVPLLRLLIWDDKKKLANLVVQKGADTSFLSDKEKEYLNTR